MVADDDGAGAGDAGPDSLVNSDPEEHQLPARQRREQ